MYKAVILLCSLMVFGFSLALALNNLSPVNVDYVFGRSMLPLAACLTIALLIGAALGCSALLPSVIRLKIANGRMRVRLQRTESELDSLRRAPLRDAS